MPAQLSETLVEIASRRFDLVPQLPSRHGAGAEAGDRCAFHQIIRSNRDLVAVRVSCCQSFDDTVCCLVGRGIKDLNAVGAARFYRFDAVAVEDHGYMPVSVVLQAGKHSHQGFTGDCGALGMLECQVGPLKNHAMAVNDEHSRFHAKGRLVQRTRAGVLPQPEEWLFGNL